MSEYILDMKNISKRFPGVLSLDQVNLHVRKGTVHALLGENGAGKSTLVKILSGLHPYGSYQGDIIFKGEKCKFHNTKDSEKMGIAFVSQELALIKQLTVAENIFLGDEIVKHGLTNVYEMHRQSKELLEMLRIDIDPNTIVSTLGMGHQQLIEILKGVRKNADVLILDEPTSSLTDAEVDILFEIIENLKKQGISFIYISHKLS